MMTQDEAKLRIEKTICNYRFMQETHMVSDYVSDSLDVRIDAGLIAVDAIDKLQKIQKIVDEFNATRDNSPMVERAYAEYTKIKKAECFDKILNLFEG